MNEQEILDFAKERRKKISYNLEMTNGLPCRTFYEKQEEMLIKAIPALEKQIPIKPEAKKTDDPIKIGNGIFGKGTTVYFCPTCGTFTTRAHKHCDNCGQKFDWSSKNE